MLSSTLSTAPHLKRPSRCLQLTTQLSPLCDSRAIPSFNDSYESIHSIITSPSHGTTFPRAPLFPYHPIMDYVLLSQCFVFRLYWGSVLSSSTYRTYSCEKLFIHRLEPKQLLPLQHLSSHLAVSSKSALPLNTSWLHFDLHWSAIVETNDPYFSLFHWISSTWDPSTNSSPPQGKSNWGGGEYSFPALLRHICLSGAVSEIVIFGVTWASSASA